MAEGLGNFFWSVSCSRMWIKPKAPKNLSSITWHVTFHKFHGTANWTDYRGKRGLDGLGIGIRPTATLNTTGITFTLATGTFHTHTKPTKCTSETVLSAMWCRRIHPFHDHRVLWPHHFPDSLCIRLLPDPHQAQDHLSKRGSKDWLRAFGHPSWCANILRHFFPAAMRPTSSPDESAAKMTAADVILAGLHRDQRKQSMA